MPNMVLKGAVCSAALSAEAITINGEYYRYDLHKRRRVTGPVTVRLADVLRVGLTKTYSRLALLVPMACGFLALLVRSIPAIELKKTFFEIEDVWDASIGVTLWSLPHQDEIWKALAVACVLTIPLYWLSYRKDLEINTMQGRYLLPRKGMDKARVEAFQRAVYAAKSSRTQ